FYAPDLPTYNYDPAKARQLLDEAGYPAGEHGIRFSIRVTYTPESPAYGENIGAALKSMWAKVGVNVTLDSTPDEPTWISRVANYKFDVTVGNVWNWGDPAIGVSRTYLCTNIHKCIAWANMSRYCNEKADKLFAKAASEPNAAKRKQ